MSDVAYPIGFIQDLAISYVDRVIGDDFEDGATSTRRLWAASAFRRRIRIQHARLKPTEYRPLADFFRARGRYDSFWFRDNSERRTGNYKVRFAAPLEEAMSRMVLAPSVMLEEVAPIVIDPDSNAVTDAVATQLHSFICVVRAELNGRGCANSNRQSAIGNRQ